ncbi:MAG: TetR/AcrR family transcriptional regulator [Geminicoccaceae bacterium]
MPWEKAFDIEITLAKAMETFWVHGYEAASMQKLVDRMGIGRGSLYATFGDKRSLFIQALRLFDQRHRDDWTCELAEHPSGKASILAAFDTVIDSTLNDGKHRYGCLLVNTAIELSPHDPEISKLVNECLSHMEIFFRDQVVRSQQDGEIPEDLSPSQTAKTLLALYVSLRVFCRGRQEPDLLQVVSAQVEALVS